MKYKYRIYEREGVFILSKKRWLIKTWLCYTCLGKGNWCGKYHTPTKLYNIEDAFSHIREDIERIDKWTTVTSENIHKYLKKNGEISLEDIDFL